MGAQDALDGLPPGRLTEVGRPGGAVTPDLSHRPSPPQAFLFLGYETAFLGGKQFDVRGSLEPWELGLRALGTGAQLLVETTL